jgi:hypothetical protein
METNIDALKDAVEQTHGGKATLLEAIPVTESFEGKKVWEGTVHVFKLEGHPKAKLAYAWSHPIERNKRRFFAVLQSPPINTPQDAVKAAIIQQYKQGQK